MQLVVGVASAPAWYLFPAAQSTQLAASSQPVTPSTPRLPLGQLVHRGLAIGNKGIAIDISPWQPGASQYCSEKVVRLAQKI